MKKVIDYFKFLKEETDVLSKIWYIVKSILIAIGMLTAIVIIGLILGSLPYNIRLLIFKVVAIGLLAFFSLVIITFIVIGLHDFIKDDVMVANKKYKESKDEESD